jgi:hypothetical protein
MELPVFWIGDWLCISLVPAGQFLGGTHVPGHGLNRCKNGNGKYKQHYGNNFLFHFNHFEKKIA